MKKLSAIVPAAGSGVRLQSKIAKPYIRLNNKPLLWYCLNALERSRKVNDIIVISEKANIKRTANLIKRFKFKKVKAVVAGGASRGESVYNGLMALDKDTDYVLIHDGARPFLEDKLIDRCLTEVTKHKAVICAVPCSSTIKQADKNLSVVSTLDRNSLWQAQTPQVFAYKLLCRAYANFKNEKTGAFDDASLVERLGRKVKIVPGANINIKITTQEDLMLARAILKLPNS
ncbi:MAG: 2-C-methyl-D-erythritol 4-phosphate cytidylyltransferase [Candidatus Omnitrophica bacterium]|nr:2-C-methyl-D-erythritol 4-phosphate cytidylyltransferase [Candidatus Omnitrophota bacterium]